MEAASVVLVDVQQRLTAHRQDKKSDWSLHEDQDRKRNGQYGKTWKESL